MMKRSIRIFAVAALILSVPSLAIAAGESAKIPDHEWQFEGHFGTFDRASLQRGFQVYKEVCASCHGMKYLSYRNLKAIGFSEEEVKAIAAQYTVTDGPNDQGEMFDRPAKPSDKFVSPFPNEEMARLANNGAYPPDLTLMTKAREGGAEYVYALLTGYTDPPSGESVMPGMYYNKYFPGHQIAMAPPLADGLLEYADGIEPTAEQMAHDVTAFLSWAAEPEMETRKRTGVRVLIFLAFLALFFYLSKKHVWAKLKDD